MYYPWCEGKEIFLSDVDFWARKKYSNDPLVSKGLEILLFNNIWKDCYFILRFLNLYYILN